MASPSGTTFPGLSTLGLAQSAEEKYQITFNHVLSIIASVSAINGNDEINLVAPLLFGFLRYLLRHMQEASHLALHVVRIEVQSGMEFRSVYT
jgi:hypothetical protein